MDGFLGAHALLSMGRPALRHPLRHIERGVPPGRFQAVQVILVHPGGPAGLPRGDRRIEAVGHVGAVPRPL